MEWRNGGIVKDKNHHTFKVQVIKSKNEIHQYQK